MRHLPHRFARFGLALGLAAAVPGNAYAGQYTATVSVTLAEGP